MTTVKFKESIMTENVVVEVTSREEVDQLCDFLVYKGQRWEESHREGILRSIHTKGNCYIDAKDDDNYDNIEFFKEEGKEIISFAEALQVNVDTTLLRVEAKESVRSIDEVFTEDTIPKLPKWLIGLSNKSLRDNPILVYFDDKSEDRAVDDGDIRLLCSVDVGDEGYPFRMIDTSMYLISREDFKSHRELLKSEKLQEAIEDWEGNINIASTTGYNFVVPVRESDWVVEDPKPLSPVNDKPVLIAVDDNESYNCVGCYFNTSGLDCNSDCTSFKQIIGGKSIHCSDDHIIYKLEEKSDLTIEQQLANSIAEGLVSLGREKLEEVIELLTKLNDK